MPQQVSLCLCVSTLYTHFFPKSKAESATTTKADLRFFSFQLFYMILIINWGKIKKKWVYLCYVSDMCATSELIK